MNADIAMHLSGLVSGKALQQALTDTHEQNKSINESSISTVWYLWKKQRNIEEEI